MLLKEHAALLEQHAALLEQYAALEHERDGLTAEVEASRAARTAAEAEVVKLRSTLSWRVTGPLRSVRAKRS